MPFIDTNKLGVIERLPGWYGRYFHTPSMTFAHYDFVRGSTIHEHFHPQEEVYEVTEGELELTIDGHGRSRTKQCSAFGQGPHRRPGNNRRLSIKTRFCLGYRETTAGAYHCAILSTV